MNILLAAERAHFGDVALHVRRPVNVRPTVNVK